MKRILCVLGFVVVALAGNAYPSEKVSPKVLASFKSEFSGATNVEWETGSSFFRASFSLNEQRFFAYYNVDGELMSTARYISPLQLPINLFKDIKNNYSKYWISDLFEISNSDGLHYYITLETGDTRHMMRSSNGSEWSTYSKSKKI